MNNIFESTEPIEEWMEKHFPDFWGAIPNDYYLDTEHFTDEVISELFREAMREWVKQQEQPTINDDDTLCVKMHQYLKNQARANPHKARMMGDVGWMRELIYLVRITDAQREDNQSQEPKASETLSEKLERLEYDIFLQEGEWFAEKWINERYYYNHGSTPLEAVQALEEQLKEGE